MDSFNTAVKSLQGEGIEHTINGIRMSKTKNLTSNINGVLKSLTIHNLPENYKAVIGIENNDTIRIKDKKIYGKYYIKIYDIFNREITNFAQNHRIATGLDITLNLSNIDSSMVLIKSNKDKIGYFDAEEKEFKLTIHDDSPLVIESSKATSTTDSEPDPSTWWVIGGIILGIIIVIAVIIYFYPSNKNKEVAEMKQPTLMYATPRFPHRYIY